MLNAAGVVGGGVVGGDVVDAGTTTIENVTVLVCAGEPESETVMPKLEVPLAVGVPEKTPEFDSVIPAGRLPELTAQL